MKYLVYIIYKDAAGADYKYVIAGCATEEDARAYVQDIESRKVVHEPGISGLRRYQRGFELNPNYIVKQVSETLTARTLQDDEPIHESDLLYVMFDDSRTPDYSNLSKYYAGKLLRDVAHDLLVDYLNQGIEPDEQHSLELLATLMEGTQIAVIRFDKILVNSNLS